MININFYFIIGVLGIILTTMVQIVTAGLFFSALHMFEYLFYLAYGIFFTLLLIGFRKILKEKRTS